jgi:peptidoglycan/LPS O-acetylase OafA/YrhL
MSSKRNHDLDGLRGLAALSVALGHSASFAGGTGLALRMTPTTFHDASWTDVTFRMLHLIFHADAAIIVFFVLSGLVLTRSLRLSRDPNLLSFTIRRVFRIFPVSITAALLIGSLRPTTWGRIIGAGLLYDTRLNGVLWTLQIELAGSALVFALWYLRHIHLAFFVIACIATFAMARYYPRPVFVFMPAFVLGALIDDLPRMKGWFLILPVSLLSLMTADFFLGVTFNTRWLQIFGAFGLITYLAQNSTRVTNNPVSNFLGTVSYPFYLLHLAGALIIIKYGILSLGLPKVLLFAVYAVGSISAALVLAWIAHSTIEKPGMRIGSRLARSVQNFNRKPLAGDATSTDRPAALEA